ncbi:MAG: efflux RND transporter permease subunit, partial [Aureibaculum sp.]
IEDLKLDVEQGKPELPIIIDRQKARRLNVSTGQIGDLMRTSLFGKEVSTYKEGEDDYPINIRLMDKYRYNKEALINQKITFRDQSSGKIVQIPISSIAHAETSSTFSAVKRKDLNRVITIFSNVLENYNPTEVNDQIKKVLTNYNIPKDISISFTGEQEQQAEEMAFLSKALLIAVFFIFLIMVGQFNSTSTPIIISLAVLLSLIGVLLGLLIFRMEFVIMMTMIGIISLAGIVVNNAIVLIDYTNLVIKRNQIEADLEEGALTNEIIYNSIVEGGKTRLRPVLLTAITTILGLLPLAIGININFMTLFTEFDPQFYIGGENVAFWGPMSWTIIFGLTFATFLTLIIVPILFFLTIKLKNRLFKNKFIVA